MFNQITIFKLASELPSIHDIEEKLASARFVPVGPTQDKSVGFMPPREEHGAMVESVNGQHIIKVAIETKSVPSSVLNEKANQACKQIEEQTGRKPGKKERRDIKDEVLLSLLPAAFPKRSNITVWINPSKRLVLIGSASATKVDAVAWVLVAALGISLQMLNTTTSPQAAMTQWLLAASPDDWPDNLNIERECLLKSIGEDAASVRFTRHHLANDEVRKHVMEGKLPTALALNWDGRVTFVLTEGLQLKKVQFLDGLMDGGDEYEDRFDADVALSTGMLDPLLDDVIYALGGEFTLQESGAA